MPDEDKNFGGSLVLDFRKWWRHMQAKNRCSATSILMRRGIFCRLRFPEWLGWQQVSRFLPAQPYVREYLCPGHTVNSSMCFSVGKIHPLRLNRMSASPQICAFCTVPVLPLTPSAEKGLDKSLLQGFTGMMVTSSCPGAGPQGERATLCSAQRFTFFYTSE